jgi:hypothetical protein
MPAPTIEDLAPTLALLKAALKPTRTTGARKASTAKLLDYGVHGDHWGDGKYWRGRKPFDKNLTPILDLYTQEDVVGPSLDRIVAGIVGRDFEWEAETQGAKPPAEGESRTRPQEELDAEEALTGWHHEAEYWPVIKRALKIEQAVGNSILRIHVPPEYREQAVEGGVQTLEEALELIHIRAITPLQAGCLRDEHGREIAYWYRYDERAQNSTRKLVELHTPEWILEVDVTTGEPQVLLDEEHAPTPNWLHDPARKRRPRYLMHELARDGGSAITASILDLQDALNEERTGMKRNAQVAAFRMIITTNADEPKDKTTGEPIPWTHGPGRTINVMGAPKDPNMPGGELLDPGVTIVPPVDPSTFIAAADAWRDGILDLFDQGHVKAQYKAVSGDSKQESRDAFEKRLTLESPPVVRAIRWGLETVLQVAAFFCGESEKYRNITFTPRLYLDVSRGNLAVFQALVPAVQANLTSLETLVDVNPAVTDVAAELERLKSQREQAGAQQTQRDAALQQLLNR